MKLQNPPQAFLEKAQDLEKYLNPTTIVSLYAAAAVLYVAFVALIFAVLYSASIVSPTPTVYILFAIVAFVPAILIFLLSFLRPQDPVSACITTRANAWRRPLDVPPDQSTFKVRLMDGAIVCVDLTFYYPSTDQTALIKERLYTYVHSALANDCSMRTVKPAPEEIERVLNRPLDMVAEEADIPVLYLEVRNVYNSGDQDDVVVDYLSTGTWN
jgi:hypothetical protein